MLFVSKKESIKSKAQLAIIKKVQLLNSQEEAVALVENLYYRSMPIVLSFINAHAYNLCCTDNNFYTSLKKSDLIFRDGIGISLLFQAIGMNPGANLNGTDLIPVLLDRLKGKRIALLGTESRYLAKAVQKLSTQGHNVVVSETGFHSLEYYLTVVKDAVPEVIILGMGMPKQEKLSILLKESATNSCLIINGGAIIDRWGDKIQRAPAWVRNLHMEWLFRLFQEPKKVFSRVGTGGYFFLGRILELRKNSVLQEGGIYDGTLAVSYSKKSTESL